MTAVSTDAPQRAEVSRLPEVCYDAIRGRILSGSIGAGQRLNESRIAEELGVSRGPVREAIRRLRHEGLVFDRPRQGSYVRTFGAQDIKDIVNLRMALETTAARLVIQSGAGTEGLDQIVGRMSQAAAAGDASGCVDAEFDFHERVCELSGNNYLLEAFRMLSGPIRLALSSDLGSNQQLSTLPGEHIRVIELLRSSDVAGVAGVIEAHIMNRVAEVLARLGDDTTGLLSWSEVTADAI
jgi:GntR family transcriptional regulator of gluconate operon